jgi:hypothetical protein
MFVVHFSFISPYTCAYAHNFELQEYSAPVTYSVQFQNVGFSLSDLICISHRFVEFSKNCAGFLSKIGCVALWTLWRVELMYFSLCNDSKTPKFGPANLYNIVAYKQGQFKGLTV